MYLYIVFIFSYLEVVGRHTFMPLAFKFQWHPSRHWRRSGIFIVNFEHISHLVLVFLLLTLNM